MRWGRGGWSPSCPQHHVWLRIGTSQMRPLCLRMGTGCRCGPGSVLGIRTCLCLKQLMKCSVPTSACRRLVTAIVTGWGSVFKIYLGKVLPNSPPKPRGEDTRGCKAVRSVVKLSKSPSQHQGAFPTKYSAPHTVLSNCFLNDLSLSAWLNLPARPFHTEHSLREKGLPT